jgi:predicted acylesterase/phospholipase RssA
MDIDDQVQVQAQASSAEKRRAEDDVPQEAKKIKSNKRQRRVSKTDTVALSVEQQTVVQQTITQLSSTSTGSAQQELLLPPSSPSVELELLAVFQKAASRMSKEESALVLAPASNISNDSKPESEEKEQPCKSKNAAKVSTANSKQSSPPAPPRLIVPNSKKQHTSTLMIFSRRVLLFALFCGGVFLYLFRKTPTWQNSHRILPKHAHYLDEPEANITLRDFLLDPNDGIYLGMAPSFFGFYGYLGVLAAWEDELSNDADSYNFLLDKIHGVAGASAGAMAAVLLASGVPPRVAAEFCTTITLDKFADPPALLAAFKGNKFEQVMYHFLQDSSPQQILKLEDAIIPVVVSGFDLQTMQGRLLKKGSMARAARASATFPGLFQPVAWEEEQGDGEGGQDYLLIDGGIADFSGLNGLTALSPDRPKRVVNLVVGDFLGGVPPGPSRLPKGLNTSSLLSVSIQNLPPCGPWAMSNGIKAVEAARRAMRASLDLPLHYGKEPGHYELHIDASSFIPEPHPSEHKRRAIMEE